MGGILDEYLILEFPARPAAEAHNANLHQQAANRLRAQGYSIVAGQGGDEIVSKGQGGVDRPQAQTTVRWDVVKESPEGTFYITSPQLDSRYAMPQGTQGPWVEKVIPPEWEDSQE